MTKFLSRDVVSNLDLNPDDRTKDVDTFTKIKYNKSEWERLKSNYAVKDKLARGVWGSRINDTTQAKHLEISAPVGASYLLKGIDPQKLFDEYSGTGLLETGKNGYRWKEHVQTGEDVGYLAPFKEKPGRIVQGITIHYSTKGKLHIVPWAGPTKRSDEP